MFSKTLLLAQVFSGVNVMIYSVLIGFESQQKEYGLAVVSGVLALLHTLVLVHLILCEKNKSKL